MILTIKEEQILSLIVAGMPDQKIAEKLGISVRTVQNHLQRIYLKTGTRNRVSAIVLYLNSNVKVIKRNKNIKRRSLMAEIGTSGAQRMLIGHDKMAYCEKEEQISDNSCV